MDSTQHMRVALVLGTKGKRCTMASCAGGSHIQEPILQVETHYPPIEQEHDHVPFASDMGIIQHMETNLRAHSDMASEITGQLLQGTLVKVMDTHGIWARVRTEHVEGWAFLSALALHEEIKQATQRTGETHQVYICSRCISTMDWGNFYAREIEPRQQAHVVGNYLFDYLPAAVALEEGLGTAPNGLLAPLLTKRILEEIESGEHGSPSRYHKEDTIRNYTHPHTH